jgi:hypothetical protein
MQRMAVAAIVVIACSSCRVLGPSCQGETGPVFSISGEVAAGAIVMHQVQYGVDGSQNDGLFVWTGHTSSEGPRLQLFATRVDCERFDPNASQTTPACSPLARAGWIDGHLVTSYIVTHGRGNPETLGPAAQYKIWIVGDAERAVQYTVSARWNRPVEC